MNLKAKIKLTANLFKIKINNININNFLSLRQQKIFIEENYHNSNKISVSTFLPIICK